MEVATEWNYVVLSLHPRRIAAIDCVVTSTKKKKIARRLTPEHLPRNQFNNLSHRFTVNYLIGVKLLALRKKDSENSIDVFTRPQLKFEVAKIFLMKKM